jgi:hypothetical protein
VHDFGAVRKREAALVEEVFRRLRRQLPAAPPADRLRSSASALGRALVAPTSQMASLASLRPADNFPRLVISYLQYIPVKAAAELVTAGQVMRALKQKAQERALGRMVLVR